MNTLLNSVKYAEPDISSNSFSVLKIGNYVFKCQLIYNLIGLKEEFSSHLMLVPCQAN